MIAHIEGKLVVKTPTFAIIDCGGVGYHINISLGTYSKMPNSGLCKLLTHLAIREDAHVLFGFAEEAERQMFLHLISVSGIGASTARMILSSLSVEEAQQAIVSGNVSVLQAVKGIGAKSAQRIIVDLKDKIQKAGIATDLSFMSVNVVKDEALAALVMLGFAKNLAEKALEKIIKTSPADTSVEQLIKLALKNL
jgi:Holliday junction DNA helicase RuvA